MGHIWVVYRTLFCLKDVQIRVHCTTARATITMAAKLSSSCRIVCMQRIDSKKMSFISEVS